MFQPEAMSVTLSSTAHQTIKLTAAHSFCPTLCRCGGAKPNCANVLNHKTAFHLVSFQPTDLLKTMNATRPTTPAARMEQEMGMMVLLSPWPRKRGEPTLDVVVSPPGNGLAEPSGGRLLVEEGGYRSISSVGGTSVWRRGSKLEKRWRHISNKEIKIHCNAHINGLC